jgi:parallel beta-helix repeat protein
MFSYSQHFAIIDASLATPAQINDYGIDLSEYTESGPIVIGGDEDIQWALFPGNGTEENPYRFENLYFNMNNTGYTWSQSALEVKQTTVYWVVRNCVFRGANERIPDPDGDFVDLDGSGIRTLNTHHGLIENCTFIWFHTGLNLEATSEVVVRNNTFHGFSVEQERDIEFADVSFSVESYQSLGRAIFGYEGSSHLRITNNRIVSWSPGVMLSNTRFSQIEGNEIIGCEEGIVLIDNSRMNNITENLVTRCLLVGISIFHSTDSFINNNSLIQNYWGLWIDDFSSNHTFSFNILENNGLSVFGLSADDFTPAQLAPQGYGLRISDSASTKLVWNDFINDDICARNDAEGSLFDYNYYSDYGGSDENQDDLGDTPYDIEGDSPTQDVHPRLRRLNYVTPTTDTTSGGADLPLETLVIIGLGAGICLVALAFTIKKRG